MSRRELVRRIESAGFCFHRSTGPHDIYRRERDGKIIPVPRHRTIKKRTALRILKTAEA